MPESNKITFVELIERFKLEGKETLSKLYPHQIHFLLVFPSNTNLNPTVWTSTNPTLTKGNTSIISRSNVQLMSSFDPGTIVQPIKKSNRNKDDFISIGRDNTADIRLTSKQVSKFHSAFFINSKHLLIKDLHSTNGTLINEVSSNSAILESFTEIQFGDTKTLYLISKDLLNILQTISIKNFEAPKGI